MLEDCLLEEAGTLEAGVLDELGPCCWFLKTTVAQYWLALT
jgi:hypothetical protein